MQNRSILRKVWEGFLDSILGPTEEKPFIERSIGMGRLREQLWSALDQMAEDGGDWAYPLDIFVGDDGSSLFSIVAQSGKLYQVPMTIESDNLALGDWTQVTEVFKPVTQSRFSVKRQKDGKYRWLSIAGTTVLNRVGEIDSSELFDCFVKQARDNGKYPRLDFYHLGESDPKVWEFGTADYLAREGVCYIASGTFDEGNLLAEAVIQACQKSDEWGNSIEFYAYAEPEIILLDPKIQVPIYKEGENTRISVVLEKDAAGLFTRMLDMNEENKRSMDAKIEEVLKKLFGGDEDGLKAFVETVDTVNRTVKNDKLIHRASTKKDPVPVPDPDEDEDDEEDKDEETDEDGDAEGDTEDQTARSIELDEAGMAHLIKQVSESPQFETVLLPYRQSIADLSAIVAEMKIKQEADSKEVTRLKKANEGLTTQVKILSIDETDKKQTWAQDLPARKTTQATYKPREVHAAKDDEDSDDESFEDVAKRTLESMPNSY